MPRATAPATAAACLVACLAAYASGEEFVVASRIFQGDAEKPVSQGKTIFTGGYVYDILEEPHNETTIYDRKRGRFVVLDPIRKLRTDVETTDIREFTRAIQAQARTQDDPFVQFLADPRFSQRDTTEADELLLTSPYLTYRLHTKGAKSPEAAFEYGEFAHWQAQLNVMLNPSALPPFGRLAVNELLEKKQLIPTEVELTLLPQGQRRTPIKLRATHRFQDLLLESDRKLVSDAGAQLTTFPRVSLEEYRGLATQTAEQPEQVGAR